MEGIMNTVFIGNKILKGRKERKITQEELANKVGVSAGAVCKWETGNSVPDITLLAPLARALATTIDELLSFTPELSEADVIQKKKEITSVFITSGYVAGEERCRKLLNEYPNSIYLKLKMAELLQIYAMMPDNKDEELYKARLGYALSLLDAVIESKEIKYVSQGLFDVASIQMLLENYEESEKAVRRLNENYIDPMIIYPQLLERQGKNEEARILCEQILLARLSHCTAALSIMARISLDDKCQDQAFTFINSVQTIQKIFDIGLHSGDYSLCKLYLRTNQPELGAKAFKTYVEGVLRSGYDYKDNPYFKDIELEVNVSGQMSIRRKMYQSLIEDTDLGAMAGIKEYEDAIELLKRC